MRYLIKNKVYDTEKAQEIIKYIKQKFGKNPKHRCPDCHRFTFWVSDEKTKNQCIWCKIENEKKEKDNG